MTTSPTNPLNTKHTFNVGNAHKNVFMSIRMKEGLFELDISMIDFSTHSPDGYIHKQFRNSDYSLLEQIAVGLIAQETVLHGKPTHAE